MTERQENERDKVELYLENYEAIKDVTDTFDDRWGEFKNSWKDQLASRLGESNEDVTALGRIPDRVEDYLEETNTGTEHYTAVRIDTEDKELPLWLFRSRTRDWEILFKEGWWKRTDNMEPIYEETENQAWVGFHHRPERNRDRAIRDKELVLYFRNMGNSDEEFRNAFKNEFYSREDEIVRVLPEDTEITGNKGDMMKAVYDIHVDAHDNFFEAYVAALKRAFEDHVVENERLVNLIDDAYEDAIDEVYR